jgi:hypothetical protein
VTIHETQSRVSFGWYVELFAPLVHVSNDAAGLRIQIPRCHTIKRKVQVVPRIVTLLSIGHCSVYIDGRATQIVANSSGVSDNGIEVGLSVKYFLGTTLGDWASPS